jgi:hypothetical protein
MLRKTRFPDRAAFLPGSTVLTQDTIETEVKK